MITKNNEAKDTNQSSILKLADLLEDRKEVKKQKNLEVSEDNNEFLKIIEESIHEDIVKENDEMKGQILEQEKSKNFLPSIQNLSAISHNQSETNPINKKKQMYELNRKENLIQNELKVLNREKKDYVKKVEKKNKIKMLMVKSDDILKRNYQNLYEDPYKIEVIDEEDLENSLDNINYILNKKPKVSKPKKMDGPHLYIFPHVATSQTYKPLNWQKTNFVVNQSIVTQSNVANQSNLINQSGIINQSGASQFGSNNQFGVNKNNINDNNNQILINNNQIGILNQYNVINNNNNQANKSGFYRQEGNQYPGDNTPLNKKNGSSEINENLIKNEEKINQNSNGLNISKTASLNNSKFSKIEPNNGNNIMNDYNPSLEEHQNDIAMNKFNENINPAIILKMSSKFSKIGLNNNTNIMKNTKSTSEEHKNDITMNKFNCEIIEEEKSLPTEPSFHENKQMANKKSSDAFQKGYNEIGSYRKHLKDKVKSVHQKVQLQLELHKKQKKKPIINHEEKKEMMENDEVNGGTINIVNKENFKNVLIS